MNITAGYMNRAIGEQATLQAALALQNKRRTEGEIEAPDAKRARVQEAETPETVQVVFQSVVACLDSVVPELASELTAIISDYDPREKLEVVAADVLKTAKTVSWVLSEELRERIALALPSETLHLEGRLIRFSPVDYEDIASHIVPIMKRLLSFFQPKVKGIEVTSHYEEYIPMTGGSHYHRHAWADLITKHPVLKTVLTVHESTQTPEFVKKVRVYLDYGCAPYPDIMPLQLLDVRPNDPMAGRRLPQPIKQVQTNN